MRVKRAGWIRKGKRKDQLPEAEGNNVEEERESARWSWVGIMYTKQWRRRIARNDIGEKKKKRMRTCY
jgi:hypothetical protein